MIEIIFVILTILIAFYTLFEMYREMWNGDDMEAVSLAPRSWLDRIDKSVPNNFILAWTVDDLLFTGSAYWYVTSSISDDHASRSADRRPFRPIKSDPLQRSTAREL